MPVLEAAVTGPYAGNIETAKRLILEALKEREALSRADLNAFLQNHPELVLDDLDIAITQLSAERNLRYSVRGYEGVHQAKTGLD
jgi:hypothetical protein